ncbi:MAG: hypothetical protein EXR44_05680 [Dehalococcoidia bacterium]|nr:hypothetical protein [Dehalococcoidia bacterium]
MYIFVVIEPARLLTEYDDGTKREDDSYAGEVVYTPPSTHRVTNIGKKRYKNIIIELKDTERPTVRRPSRQK